MVYNIDNGNGTSQFIWIPKAYCCGDYTLQFAAGIMPDVQFCECVDNPKRSQIEEAKENTLEVYAV